MTTIMTVPPSMADAEKAAEAIVSEGVSAVLVFGSVARGEAGPHSDIDLVAVYDDLDYTARREISTELGRLASAAAGCRVFVYVTDWPEWTRRTAEVSTSLECAAAAHAVTLHRREPNGVRWGKEIGMPATDGEEAAARLDNTRRALFGVYNNLSTGPAERDALEDGDPGYYLFGMRDRMCALFASAQMAVETGLKALLHLTGVRPARTHDLGKLLDALPAAHSAPLRRLFAEVTPVEASMWREAGAYEYAERPLDSLVACAFRMARIAAAASRYAADRLPDAEAAPLIHKTAEKVEAALDVWNLSAEDPFDMAGLPPPPESVR